MVAVFRNPGGAASFDLSECVYAAPAALTGSFFDTNVTPGTTYHYGVVNFSEGGSSSAIMCAANGTPTP